MKRQSTLEYKEQLKQDTDWKLMLKGTYNEGVQFVLKKYGPIEEIYSKAKTRGYLEEVHHIKENEIAALSSEKNQKKYPEYQQPHLLCRANYNEHAVLHYLISKEYRNRLGMGGLIKHGMLERCKDYMTTADYVMFEKLVKDEEKEHKESLRSPESVSDLLLKELERIEERKQQEQKRKSFIASLSNGWGEITPQQYAEFIHESKKASRYSVFLYYKIQDKIIFMTQNKKGQVLIWYCGDCKITSATLQEIEKSFIEKWNYYEAFNQKRLEMISTLKEHFEVCVDGCRMGLFNPEGAIDPLTRSICFHNIDDFCESRNLDKKQVIKALNKANISIADNNEDFYTKDNRIVKKIEHSLLVNILCTWEDIR